MLFRFIPGAWGFGVWDSTVVEKLDASREDKRQPLHRIPLLHHYFPRRAFDEVDFRGDLQLAGWVNVLQDQIAVFRSLICNGARRNLAATGTAGRQIPVPVLAGWQVVEPKSGAWQMVVPSGQWYTSSTGQHLIRHCSRIPNLAASGIGRPPDSRF